MLLCVNLMRACGACVVAGMAAMESDECAAWRGGGQAAAACRTCSADLWAGSTASTASTGSSQARRMAAGHQAPYMRLSTLETPTCG
jgi:hypothetical protein